jgi:hypothetical protein
MQKFFKPEEGLEQQADRAVHTACRKYVTDMHYESCHQCHIDYYALVRKMSLSKTEARQTTLTGSSTLRYSDNIDIDSF